MDAEMAIRLILLVETAAPHGSRFAASQLAMAVPGAGLLTAHSLIEARECLRHGGVDILILSLGGAGDDGLAAIAELRASYEADQLPVVVLTPDEDTEFAVNAIGCGADEVMGLGEVRPEVLGRALQLAVARRRRRDAASRAEAPGDELTAALAQRILVLERFAVTTAHDLRAPLQTARGYLELVANRSPHATPELLEAIERSIAVLGRLAEQIDCSLAAVREGGRRLNPAAGVESSAVLTAVLADLAEGVQESGAVVTWEWLPSVAVGQGDLARLLLNVVGNAIKYRAANRQPRIEVRATEWGGNLWRFRIKDNGIGIAAADLTRILAFGQRGVGQEDLDGYGIGLAISSEIVRRVGGEIWLESAPGVGTEVSFTLPRADLFPATRNHFTEAEAARMPRVLLVDDDCEMRHYLTQVFSHAGFAVQCAAGLAEALQVTDPDWPEIAILDLELGDARGETVLKALRSRGVRAPAIALSGHGRQDIAARCHGPEWAATARKGEDILGLIATCQRLVGLCEPSPQSSLSSSPK